MTLQIPQNYLLQNNIRNLLDKISKLFKKILPIYWAFLTYMLLRPGVEDLEFPLFEGMDKVIHLLIFAMLGFCLKAAFPKLKFLYCIQIIIIYGMLTEILQDEMNLGRSFEGLDLVADILGALIGFYIFEKIKNLSL